MPDGYGTVRLRVGFPWENEITGNGTITEENFQKLLTLVFGRYDDSLVVKAISKDELKLDYLDYLIISIRLDDKLRQYLFNPDGTINLPTFPLTKVKEVLDNLRYSAPYFVFTRVAGKWIVSVFNVRDIELIPTRTYINASTLQKAIDILMGKNLRKVYDWKHALRTFFSLPVDLQKNLLYEVFNVSKDKIRKTLSKKTIMKFIESDVELQLNAIVLVGNLG